MPGPLPQQAAPGSLHTPPWWRRWRSRRVEVHDESMLPTLRPGDRLLVDTGAYRRALPTVGEIVVLVDPESVDRWLVKRVAGVGPGHFWMTRAGLVPAEPTAPTAVPPDDAIESLTLGASMLYVTGDAAGARDSRRFGPIRFEAVVGRVYRCYTPMERRRNL
ncbi:MAG: S26 family signal peptidase [Thermoplasmata archaeon]